MVHTPKDSIAHRKEKLRQEKLSPEERRQLIEPFLPPLNSDFSDTDTPLSKGTSGKPPRTKRAPRRQPIRTLIRFAWYRFVYLLIHVIFSVYVRSRRAFRITADRITALLWYHNHSSEQVVKDVQNLSRLPKHLSVVLHHTPEHEGGSGLTGLIEGAADVAAWSAAAGIERLSIYEKRGLLKRNLAYTHSSVRRKFHAYFNDPPTTSMHGPRSSPASPQLSPQLGSPELGPALTTQAPAPASHLSILLISEEDSRPSIVDLTRTLANLAQSRKLSAEDINVSLVDNELTASVMTEPDLLLLFGPSVKLEGYPVWQVRLTEIFHKHDISRQQRVNYQVFLDGIRRFANTESRVGR